MIYVKLKLYQILPVTVAHHVKILLPVTVAHHVKILLPVTVAHHVKILIISFVIVINIQIIGKYYLIVLIGYLLALILM
jgi:hypothetical protein